jgi:hypothetical protein
MYTLQDIMNQALDDRYALQSSGIGYRARVLYGCKIIQDDKTEEIEILNTALTGDWYLPITNSQKEIFLKKGWRIGVYELSLSNYRTKLDKIEERIKSEVNGKKNPKQINSLKKSRQKVMNEYSKINKKLNRTSNDTT